MTVDNGVADHSDQWRGDFWGDFAKCTEDIGEFDLMCQCAGVGGLNNWTVGDWVRVRDANFAQMRAAFYDFAEDFSREPYVRIARRDEWHQRFALLAAEFRE